jgi:hypothetical protein
MPRGCGKYDPVKFICVGCGVEAEYRLEKNKRTYCTHACYMAQKIKNRGRYNCDACGTEFLRSPSHYARKQKGAFCSKKCQGLGQLGEANSQFKGAVTVQKNCRICKKEFEVAWADRNRRTTCASKECQSARRSLTRSKPSIAKNCEVCATEFLVKPSGMSRRYCSWKCSSAAHAHRIAGKANGRYVHGEAMRAYPPGWTKTHKAQIRERDGHCCKRCGMTAEAHNTLLHVHHIDYVKDNLDESNLITLCKYCHGQMHGRKESRVLWKEELSRLLEKQA